MKLFGAPTPVIRFDKPNFSVCALGAGAAHAAVLALALPVMITLPAPMDNAQGTVAVRVDVRTVRPATFVEAAMSGGSAVSDVAPAQVGEVLGEREADYSIPAVPAAEEVTGALPETSKSAAVVEDAPLIERPAMSEAAQPATPADASLPVVPPEVAPAVASLELVPSDEPDFMPDLVPRPLRKPSLAGVEGEIVRAPVRKRVRRTRSAGTPVFRGILGGRPATTMPEFPFPAAR